MCLQQIINMMPRYNAIVENKNYPDDDDGKNQAFKASFVFKKGKKAM